MENINISYTANHIARLKDIKTLANRIKIITDDHKTRLTSLEDTTASHTSNITTLNIKTQFITKNDASDRRNIAGFRDLGTSITDVQRTAIKNDDWWNFGIGDY